MQARKLVLMETIGQGEMGQDKTRRDGVSGFFCWKRGGRRTLLLPYSNIWHTREPFSIGFFQTNRMKRMDWKEKQLTFFPIGSLRSELAREKMWSRIHLIPMLQAEEDRDLVRRTWADKARERELLGTETRVYHSDRWVLERVFVCLLGLYVGVSEYGFYLLTRVSFCRFVRPTYSISPQNVSK